METPAEAIERLAARRRTSLTELSILIGRNAAYLQQYIRRGTPRTLAERDRRTLAQFFGVDETILGAEPVAADVAVPYLSVEASAGAGTSSDDERVIRHAYFARAMLREAGVAPGQASLIDVLGDSMAPGVCAGDRLLVDRGDRRVTRSGAIMVVRRGGDLLVKRAAATGGAIELRSDNPAYATISASARDIVVIGRVKLLLRTPG